MEEAIIKWLITVGVPLVAFFLTVFNKTKESERRVTVIESNQKYNDEKVKEITKRVATVENNYAVLIRVEEQLKTLFKQNEEIKEEVRSVTRSNHSKNFEDNK